MAICFLSQRVLLATASCVFLSLLSLPPALSTSPRDLAIAQTRHSTTRERLIAVLKGLFSSPLLLHFHIWKETNGPVTLPSLQHRRCHRLHTHTHTHTRRTNSDILQGEVASETATPASTPYVVLYFGNEAFTATFLFLPASFYNRTKEIQWGRTGGGGVGNKVRNVLSFVISRNVDF